MFARIGFLICCATTATAAGLATPTDLLQAWRTEARAQSSGFGDFSTERGKMHTALGLELQHAPFREPTGRRVTL